MGATTLPPGSETTVALTMMMHPGMEGPHLFRLTVPVRNGERIAGYVKLYVRANFR